MAEKLKLTGIERAAILLRSIGGSAASEVVKRLGPQEVEDIGQAMASSPTVSKMQVEQVLTEFVELMNTQTSLGSDPRQYLTTLLDDALGYQTAHEVLERIYPGASAPGLEMLKWTDPRTLTEIIRTEHPQVSAVILSYLEPEVAAAALSALPEEARADILARVASLDGVQPNALKLLDDVLYEQLSTGRHSLAASNVGGTAFAAEILHKMEKSVESSTLTKVQALDSGLGERIEEMLLVFDNLVDIDDRGLQDLLREVHSDALAVALRGATDAVREKIFRNMSRRAAQILKDDMEARGPVRLSEVQSAQREILAIARRMQRAGDISLDAGDEFI